MDNETIMTTDEEVIDTTDDIIETDVEETTEEVTNDDTTVEDESTEDDAPAIDEENPLAGNSGENIKNLIKNVENILKIMEEQWLTTCKEWNITNDQINKLHVWNLDHRTMLADDATDEEKNNWDPLNGINTLTEEAVVDIFGADNPIIGVEHTITLDRINDVFHDWFSYASARKEYKQIHDAYLELLETEEEKQLTILKEAIDKEEDLEKKAKLQESYDLYYNRKYLDFLNDPISDEQKNRIINVLKNEEKATYLINRTKTKLTQMKVAPAFILELSQFEKRFLDEKYHKCNQCLLVYFMQTLVYSNTYDKKDPGTNKAMCMIFGMDAYIRGTHKPEIMERIKNNIHGLLDQLIDDVPVPETSDEDESVDKTSEDI